MAPLELTGLEFVKLRSRSQVCSRSGSAGPWTKDKDLDMGYTLNLVCHHPPPNHHSPPNFSWAINHFKPLLYDF